MSSSKLDSSDAFDSSINEAEAPFRAVLRLPQEVVHIRKNGIEFISPKPVAAWTELTVQIQPARGGHRIVCNGIVVQCHGSASDGFVVSLIFFNLSPQSQEQLSALAGQ